MVEAELELREQKMSSRGDNEQYMIKVKFKHSMAHLKVDLEHAFT